MLTKTILAHFDKPMDVVEPIISVYVAFSIQGYARGTTSLSRTDR